MINALTGPVLSDPRMMMTIWVLIALPSLVAAKRRSIGRARRARLSFVPSDGSLAASYRRACPSSLAKSRGTCLLDRQLARTPLSRPECTFPRSSGVGDRETGGGSRLGSSARLPATPPHSLAREQFDVVHAVLPARGSPTFSMYRASPAKRPGCRASRLALRAAGRAPPGRRRAAAAGAESARVPRAFGECMPPRRPFATRSSRATTGSHPEDMLVVPPAVNLEEFRPPDDKAAARVAAGIDDSERARPALLRQRLLPQRTRSGDRRPREIDASGAAPRRRRRTRDVVPSPGRQVGSCETGCGSWDSRHDAWRFYQAADVVVLPTRADVWGMTPIEGMASGVPPIVTAAAGSASTIRNNETGIVLPEPFSTKALVDAIDLLAADPERREAIGAAGVRAASEHSRAARLRQVEDDLVAVTERRIGAEPIRPRRRRFLSRRWVGQTFP